MSPEDPTPAVDRVPDDTEGYERWEDKIDYFLENLGLQRDDLLSGEVLDIGGAEGEFAALAKANGLQAHIRILEPTHEKTPYPDLVNEYVLGTGQDMSAIADESIDLVTAHCSVPNLFRYGEGGPNKNIESDIANLFEETVRILRTGGRARFGPISFVDADEFPTEARFKQAIEDAVLYFNGLENIRCSLVPNGDDIAIDANGVEIPVPKFYIAIEKA